MNLKIERQDIEKMAAVQNERQEGIIGHLTWWTIKDMLVTRDELKEKLEAVGLDISWLPNEIRPSDAFRRATKQMEGRKETTTPGVYQNILVREVYSDRKVIQRNFVVETVDQAGRRLDYDGQAAVLIYNKNSDYVEVAVYDKQLESLVSDACDLFDIYKTKYPSQAVRSMIYDIIQSMSPTPVRASGGVYFVPAPYNERLGKLCKFLSNLEGCEAFKVPLIDTMDNRHLVNQKLREYLDDILSQCQKALDPENGVSNRQLKEIVTQAKRVIGDFKDYRNIVTSDISALEDKINLIREKVALMLEAL